MKELKFHVFRRFLAVELPVDNQIKTLGKQAHVFKSSQYSLVSCLLRGTLFSGDYIVGTTKQVRQKQNILSQVIPFYDFRVDTTRSMHDRKGKACNGVFIIHNKVNVLL